MSNINTQILIHALSQLSKSNDAETSKIAHNALVESNAVNIKSLNVLIGIDVSGSSFIPGILQKLKEIDDFFNTQVTLIVRYTVMHFNHKLLGTCDYDDISIISEDDIVVDGGTDMNVYYDYLESRPNDFDKWFIITDKFGMFPSKNIDKKHTYNYLETRMLVY